MDGKKLLEEYNLKYMDPPLRPNEVTTIQKQVRQEKADGTPKYSYKCNDQPIVSCVPKGIVQDEKNLE